MRQKPFLGSLALAELLIVVSKRILEEKVVRRIKEQRLRCFNHKKKNTYLYIIETSIIDILNKLRKDDGVSI